MDLQYKIQYTSVFERIVLMCMLLYISALFGNVKCEQNVNASQKQLFCGLEIRDDSFRDDRMEKSLFLVNIFRCIFMVSATI